jgi:putative Ig domain-containing protein/IPT/TIG domain-containing protein
MRGSRPARRRGCRRLILLALGLVLALGAAAPAALAAGPPRWVRLTPASSPPVGFDDPMAYDAATGQFVLLDGSTNSTWTWDGSTWTRVATTAIPSGVSEAQMAYDASTKQLILFATSGTTWNWTGSNWVRLTPATSPPPTRQDSLAYDGATSQLVLFGGQKSVGGSTTISGDTWTWNGVTWTQQHPAASPSARLGAGMAYDPASSQMLLFGGSSGQSALADTWNWTGTTWAKLNPTASPTASSFSAMAYDSATQQFLLQGGGTITGPLAELWAWNGSTWVKQTPATAITPARYGRAMAYDTATSQLVLFGGATNATTSIGDTWVWTPLAVQTASLAAAAVGVPYSATLQAISGTAPYTWSVSAGALPAGLTLSAGGVISGTPTTAATASFTVTALDATTPTATQATRAFTLTVNTSPRTAVWVGNGANSDVNAFSPTATGNATPIATLSGALTGLNGVAALTFDPVGELWAVSANNDALDRFAPGATGNVAPTRVVSGQATGLVTPSGIALDSTGRLYVTEEAAQTIAIFPAGATGNTAPVATIAGPSTALSQPTGIVISGGKIWVTNQANDTLTAYPMTASGNAAPSATISGPSTQLNHPAGLGLDGAGNLLVANFFGASVLKFPLAGPFGNVAPKAVIGGAGAQLNLPTSVDSDASGHVYVANEGAGLNVYTATGTAPTAVITGPATGLRAPNAVAVAPPLNLTTRILPRAALGRRYAQRLSAILGQAPLRWRLVKGHLPRGLKLTRSGQITGVARGLGRFHLTVSVRDSGRPAQVAKARVTLVVARAPTVTGVKRSRGSHRGGATVTVTGAGFAKAPGATAISFGRIRAPHVRCSSTRRCTLRTPPSRAGVVTVTATAVGLASAPSPRARYRFTR